MQKLVNIFISIALIQLLCSCAKKNKNTDSNPIAETKSLTVDGESIKLTSDITYKNIKIGEISQLQPSANKIEKQIAKYKKQALTELTVPSSFNAFLFKSVSDEAANYTIAPKAFAYGLFDPSHKIHEANGYLSMQMNLVFIDGLTSVVHDDLNTLIIPDGLRLKNFDSLKQQIANLEHRKIDSIDVLSGCPTRIVISTADLSYDITPENIADKNFCLINIPTSFQFKIPEETADKIFSKALPANGVNIKVDYSVKYPIETKKFLVEFDSEKLGTLIATLAAKNKIDGGKNQLSMILDEILANSEVNDSLAESFREQLKTIAVKTEAELANPQNFGKKEFNVAWSSNRDFSTDTVINIGSKLKQLTDEQASFGRDPQWASNNNPEFTNLNKNNIYNVSLVPQKGQWIEIQPTMYQWERRKRDAEANIFHSSQFRCKTVNNSASCLYINMQDKFTQEYTGNEAWVKAADPMASWNQSLSLVKLFFQFSNGESFTCSMNELEAISNQTTTRIKINNTQRCPLFNTARTTITGFGLINAIDLGEIKYIAGQRFVSFNFEEENYNTYKEVTYSPEVRLAGKLRLIGQGFVADTILK